MYTIMTAGNDWYYILLAIALLLISGKIEKGFLRKRENEFKTKY